MAESQLATLFAASNESREEDVNAAVLAGEESMEAATLEIREAGEEVASIEADIASLEEIEEGLSHVHASMEATLEKGGMDPIAAQFAHHAVGAYTERLGVEAADMLPSLESFGGDTGQQSATTVSVEAVSDTLKKIWNAIKAAVEKAIKAVSDFFTNVFGGINKVKNRLDAVEKEIKAIGSDNKVLKDKAKASVNSPNTLQYGGAVTPKALVDGMKALVKQNDKTFGNYLKGVDDAYKTMANNVTAIKDADDEEKAATVIKTNTEKERKLIESAELKQGITLPGDKAFMTKETKDSDGETSTVSLGNSRGAKSFSGDAKIDPLTVAQMNDLIAEARKVVEYVEKSESDIKAVKKAREAAMDEVKKIVDASERGRVGKVWTKAKGQKALRSTQKDLLKPVTQLVSLDFSVLRSIVGTIESSIKQYEEPKKSS